MLTILLADDHTMVREGLRLALESEEGVKIVAEAGDGHEAVTQAFKYQPDVIIMDIAMPGLDGIEACQEIRDRLPNSRIIMLTALREEASVTASLLAGAQGYLLKTSTRAELISAVRRVANGESTLDPTVTQSVIARFSQLITRERERDVENLTPRQHDVLTLVVRGMTNREIAEKLIISEFTARNTVSAVLTRFGLVNRSDLVRWAVERGIGTRDT